MNVLCPDCQSSVPIPEQDPWLRCPSCGLEADLSRLEILRLAKRAAETEPTHLHGLVLGHKQTDQWTTPGGDLKAVIRTQ